MEATEDEPPEKPVTLMSMLEERHLLPFVLVALLLVGGACMLTVQRHLVHDLLGDSRPFAIAWACAFLVTLGCMGCVAFSDPGLHHSSSVPDRSHKSWQYEPV